MPPEISAAPLQASFRAQPRALVSTTAACGTIDANRARYPWRGYTPHSSKPGSLGLCDPLDSEDGHDPMCLPGARNKHKGTPSY